MTHHISTLGNGLRAASETLPNVESVAVAVSVDVGSRYEAASEGGISHMLEHMAFKGTQTRSARDIAEQFDTIGGQFNAYTSVEHTVYHAKVLKEHLPLAMEILADILTNSVFDPAELKREQGVILQEIAMHRDTPDDYIFDLLDEAAFPDQPIGRSILGTPELIESYTRDDVVGYMRKHYTPARMVLSAAGAVDHQAFADLAAAHFSSLPGGEMQDKPQAAVYRGGETRHADELEQLHLLLGFPGISVHHKDYYAMALTSAILGGGMSSRLFQEIREKRGMAYHVSSMLSSYSDCGMFAIYSATGEEQSTELPLLIMDELRRMASDVTPAELTRVKNQQRAELLMLRESPGKVASWLGKHLLVYGRCKTLAEILDQVAAVTREDVQRMAARITETKTPSLAALGPIAKLPAYEAIHARLDACA